MYPQHLLIALVAPLVLSLPQQSNIHSEEKAGALVARHETGNITAGREGHHHRLEYHDQSEPRHPERHFIKEPGAGNSTRGGSEGRYHGTDRKGEKHIGEHHAQRDLTERERSDPSNSTRSHDHEHDFFKGDHKHHDGSNKPRDLPPLLLLNQRHEKPSGNFTTHRHHSEDDFHHHGKHLDEFPSSYNRKGEEKWDGKGRNGTTPTTTSSKSRSSGIVRSTTAGKRMMRRRGV